MNKRIFVAISVALASSACGLISGVSDDYTFDASADGSVVPPPLVDGAPNPGLDSSKPPGVDASPDASPPPGLDAGRDASPPVCNSPVSMGQVPSACYDCFTANCCDKLQKCTAGDLATKCTAYMQCISKCKRLVVGDPCRLACANDLGGAAEPTGIVACGARPTNGCNTTCGTP